MAIQVSDLPLKYQAQIRDKLRALDKIEPANTVPAAAPRQQTQSPVSLEPDTENATSKSRPSRHEEEEQCELIVAFEAEFPLLADLLIHIPNGGSRKNKFEGWRLKKSGTKAGVSDLFLPVPRGGFFGLWIEFKAAPPHDSKVSEKQAEWIKKMRMQGYRAEVGKGVVEAMEIFRNYLSKNITICQ